MSFKELDTVIITKDHGLDNSHIGMVGTIVHIFSKPTLAYEVEFCDEFGQTTLMATLLPHQIKSWNPTEQLKNTGIIIP